MSTWFPAAWLDRDVWFPDAWWGDPPLARDPPPIGVVGASRRVLAVTGGHAPGTAASAPRAATVARSAAAGVVASEARAESVARVP